MSSETVGLPQAEYPDVVGAKEMEQRTPAATFRPYVAPEVVIPEFTPLPLIVGTILGMIFGASSLYLVLKVGLTVSASIPVAVISITLFSLLAKLGARKATILENNIVQTAGSAGESIAFGVGVTMPAIMILGFDLELTRVMLVAVLGGLLGILMMIPLRRALIVQQHGVLKYPEGTACAEVLKAGAADTVPRAEGRATNRLGAATIFAGFGIGFIYKTLMSAFKGWKDVPEKVFGPPFKGGSVSLEISPELLGVGYIIGPRISSVMAAGGVLAYLVLIPMIKLFGEYASGPIPPGTVPISEMEPNDIRGAYILYIGAGAVAAGGIISLFRSLPTIWHGLKEGLRDFRPGSQAAGSSVPRTERDLSMKFVFGGIIALVIAIITARPLHMNLLGAILIIAFGFLFVTVSSRLTGEIGSSANPISGMTVATLLLTCLIFLIVGWTGPQYYVTALSVGAIVCIAASNGGTTSQDLKTGFLIGATPKYQQIAILVGALASALILGPILIRLNDNGTVYVPRVTLEPFTQGVTVIEPQRLSELPLYAERTGVSGEYRVLAVRPDAPVAGLTPGEYLVDQSGRVVYKIQRNFPAELRADVSKLSERERIKGPQARSDAREYFVWHKTDTTLGPAGKYLVDDSGVPVYYVDPGVNGTHKVRPDGTPVTKFDAPKATLMSYIIKGVLDRQLPWGLVLLGVMIAVVFELSGIPSLAFAVGVYLPLSTSAPLFVGGMIRWLVDRSLRRREEYRRLTEEEFAAEADRSPGVLLASGYIAGGAVTGIIIAFMAGPLERQYKMITEWARANNPFFEGPYADVLALIPFLALVLLLYLVGRGRLLSAERSGQP
jgi:putative OPT family oligopeptide transporter